MNIPVLTTNGTGNVGNDGTDSLFNTGITLPAMSTVVIRVSGGITVSANPLYTCCHLGSPAFSGTVGPKGVALGYTPKALEVQLQFGNASQHGGWWGGIVATQDPSDSYATVDTIHVDSAVMLWVGRTGIRDGGGCYGYPGTEACYCPEPCEAYGPVGAYALSGTQTITIERLDDDVSLSAVTQFGDTGRLVTFTPTLHNASGSTTIQWWEWIPDDSTGARTTPCTYGTNPCTTRVYESGTMKLKVLFQFSTGNKTRVATVHVEAVPCTRPDTAGGLGWINSASGRKALSTMWTNSNPTDDSTVNRKEQTMTTYHDPVTMRRFADTEDDPAGVNSPCQSATTIAAPPGMVLDMTGHTHPFHFREPVPDSTATNGCPGPNKNGEPNVYDYTGKTGAFSDLDWVVNRLSNAPIFALDFDYLHWADHITSDDEKYIHSKWHKIPRSLNGCALY